MNIHISHPAQPEPANLKQSRSFEHPALTLAQGLIRPAFVKGAFVKIEIAGLLVGLVSLIVLLKVGLAIYRLLIEPFSFPNLNF